MSEMIVQVRNKMLRRIGGVNHFVSHNKDYTIQFQFDESWDNVRTKMAVFAYEDGEYGSEIFDGDTCTVPELPREGRILVGVKAGEELSTELLCISVCKSADDVITDEYDEPDPKIYEQILDIINNLWNGGTTVYPSPVRFLAAPNKAEVGQFVRVKKVDENGEVEETEAVDVESEKELVVVNITEDADGVLHADMTYDEINPLRYTHAVYAKWASGMYPYSTSGRMYFGEEVKNVFVFSSSMAGTANWRIAIAQDGSVKISSYELELVGRKVQTVDDTTGTGDDAEKNYPSAKAVYNALANVKDKDAVKFVEQELTEKQKQQARENIEAEKRIIVLTNPSSLDVFNAVMLGGIVVYREGTNLTSENETFLFPYSNRSSGTGYVQYQGLAVGYEKGIVYQYNSQNGMDGAKLKFTPKTEISLYEQLKYFTIASDGLLKSQGLAPKPTYTTVPIPNMDSDDGKILRAHKDKWEISNLVISDWAQNDETAEDYIRNRPGGYDVVDSATILWDGSSDTGGFYYYSSGMFLVHVSDTILSREELSNAKVYNNDDPDTELEAGSISEGDGYFVDYTRGVVVATALYAKPYSPQSTLNKTGVFFNCRTVNNVRHYTSKLVIQNTKEVKIPSKYLDLEQPLSSRLPIPTTAQVGQIVKVKSVDESGKITETESSDFPTASPTTLGGVKPIAKTDSMTQEVGIDADGKLYTKPSSSSGGSITFEQDGDYISITSTGVTVTEENGYITIS